MVTVKCIGLTDRWTRQGKCVIGGIYSAYADPTKMPKIQVECPSGHSFVVDAKDFELLRPFEVDEYIECIKLPEQGAFSKDSCYRVVQLDNDGTVRLMDGAGQTWWCPEHCFAHYDGWADVSPANGWDTP